MSESDSTSEIGDAPLYNSCSLRSKLWQQDHCQHPQNANPEGSTLEGTAQRFGGGGAEGHIIPPHIFEVGLKVNTKVCWRVWWSPGAIRGPVADPGCGSRTQRRPTSPKWPRLGFRRSATTLYPSLTSPLPLPEPAEVLRFGIRREHHQRDLPQHQSQSDRRYPTSIRRARGKGMLSVPDSYRSGD